jgi:dihydrofolate reductase
MTIISIIVAMDRNRVIGKGGVLPWNLPSDMAHFQKITMGHPIIMGRKTFQSIGKALPGRTNIVMSRRKDTYAPGCIVVKSVEDAIWLGKMSEGGDGEDDELFVIGGGEVYREFLSIADRLYITQVKAEIDGDTHFPEVDWTKWLEVSRSPGTKDAMNPYEHEYIRFERVSKRG